KSMKIDLHVHTGFSPDSFTNPEKVVLKSIKAGLDCIAITDHNTIDGALEAKSIFGANVIIGEEIKSRGGEIVGLYLQECIPKELSALDTVKLIKDQGGLVSIPHPFDYFRRSVIDGKSLETIIDYIDIVESFNARNTLSKSNMKALAFAKSNHIISSAVSDAHTLMEIGRTYMDVPQFDGTPLGLKESVRNAELICRSINPMIHVLTTMTKTIKTFNLQKY
ncbi:PHP domain-containing protein, partial [Dehalococcoidia bacterium]|nr:PHP domain-containing protein [Dehalococcoidia bacterium]